jgi:hypothetical protein
MSEKEEQIALFKRAQFNPITREFMFAIPNGGKRDLREAVSFKRQGVCKGIPDIFLAYPVAPWAGLWIELKRPKVIGLSKDSPAGKLTKEQKEWLKRLKKVGYDTYSAYGWLDAWAKIENYLRGK